MPSGRYRFMRNGSVSGFLSENTPCTDARNALSEWSGVRPQRKYCVQFEEDAALIVELTWIDSDATAGLDLDESCKKFGVNRYYETA